MSDDQPVPPAPQSNDYADNETARPKGNAVPEVKIPPSHSGYSVTCHKQRDKWDIAKLIGEFIGLGFLITYTLYTAGIYCANKKAAIAAQGANDVATRTMRIDQRSWMAPRIIHQIFKEGQPLVVTTQFDNTGKTPALKLKTCQVAEIVEQSRKDVDISCPARAYSPGFDVVFPGNHVNRISNPAGDGGKVVVSKDGLLRMPLMEELRHRKKTVFVYGRIDYRDVFDKPHWATFCSAMLIMPPTPGGMPETVSWITCESGNDVDPEDTQNP